MVASSHEEREEDYGEGVRYGNKAGKVGGGGGRSPIAQAQNGTGVKSKRIAAIGEIGPMCPKGNWEVKKAAMAGK